MLVKTSSLVEINRTIVKTVLKRVLERTLKRILVMLMLMTIFPAFQILFLNFVELNFVVVTHI